MLFWLCLIVLIVGIGLVAVGKMEWFDARNENFYIIMMTQLKVLVGLLL